jgi:hypothetical protein
VSLRLAALIAALVTLVAAPAAQARTHRLAAGESFAHAYRAARSGDVIVIPAGVYGPQEVPSGSKAVTFRGLRGNKVRKLDNYSANVTFDGIDVDAAFKTPDGAAFESHGVPNVTFKNGRVGNVIDQKGALLGGWEKTASLHLVIDNVVFHDVIQDGPEVHNECIFSQAPGLVLRNSTFRNCATMDLMITRGDFWGQPPYGGVTIENNVFAHSVNGRDPDWHYYGLLLHGNMGQLTNVRVVNNTFETPVGGITTDDVHRASGVWANNIGGGWDCLPGMTYRGNVGKRCNGSDKGASPQTSCAPPACGRRIIAPVGWVDSVGYDFHLKASSRAIGAADPAYATARDRDGRVRDGDPDAGAYEYRHGGAPAPKHKRWRLRSASLRPRVVCRPARPGCPSTTRLRLRLGRAAKVSVGVLRAGKRVRAQRLRRVARHKGTSLSARGLKAGRYRVRVQAGDAAGRWSKPVFLKLRVR